MTFIKNLTLLLALILFISACQNNSKTANTNSSDEPTSENSSTDTTPPPSVKNLDEMDFNSMKKISSKYEEAGDCGVQTTHYQKEDFTLVTDTTDCGDYGTTYTFYLLDANKKIQKVHEKSITPFYEENNGEVSYFYELTKRIIDFQQADKPMMKSVTDTVSRDMPDLKVPLDEDYQGAPWVILNEKGDDFAFGQPINYKGNWENALRTALKQQLWKVKTMPASLPMQMNGTVGMGHRGNIRDIWQAAFDEVHSSKQYDLNSSYDHFTRITKPMKETNDPSEYLTIEHWQRNTTL